MDEGDAVVRLDDPAVVARDYVASSIILRHLSDLVPELSSPLRARRLNGVFVAEKAR